MTSCLDVDNRSCGVEQGTSFEGLERAILECSMASTAEAEPQGFSRVVETLELLGSGPKTVVVGEGLEVAEG